MPPQEPSRDARGAGDSAADDTLARLALRCLDLTSLGDQDDAQTIDALAAKARAAPLSPAALCVWPRLVAQARASAPAGSRIAAVANFPDGALDEARALADVQQALTQGADEIDLVLPWRALIHGDRTGPTRLVRRVREATPGKTLKLILESGELPDRATLQAACAIGLDEGADFLKTSTGKTAHGASPQAARAMLEAIAAHPRRASVGFKCSGGVRTLADARVYADLVREILGEGALVPTRWRIGASGLMDDLLRVLGLAPALDDGASAGY